MQRFISMNNKHIIYQLFVRLFGNKTTANIPHGTINQNGCGKFADVSHRALNELKLLGVTHIWYTGLIEHSTITDYSHINISPDHPCVVKGRAGSPYAIKDYYDVDPDLAINPAQRMAEFEQLVERTHQAGLQVIIDFVPNHLARKYSSDASPAGVRDFGADDNTSIAFSPQNNFYYHPGRSFKVPYEHEAQVSHLLADSTIKQFDETPAKTTGNDIFSHSPTVNDWFETVKLNYGVDYADCGRKYFDPTPDTWLKMLDILLFWAKKGINGFRCDMCEMVPTEFWRYAIEHVKNKYPHILFIGEAYNPHNYRDCLCAGFDSLYDKVGLYDALRAIARGESDFRQLAHYHHSPAAGIEKHMLAFLENHDEQRIASHAFLGNPFHAIPIMTLAATLHPGAVMIYNGQESGEEGNGAHGFAGSDGRTSIFDYGSMPHHQRWMNGGAFDSGASTDDERRLRLFYQKLLNLCRSEPAIATGKFVELQEANASSEGFNPYKNHVFMRYTDHDRLIVFTTVDSVAPDLQLRIPQHQAQIAGINPEDNYQVVSLDLGLDHTFDQTHRGADLSTRGLRLRTRGKSAAVLKIIKI